MNNYLLLILFMIVVKEPHPSNLAIQTTVMGSVK